MKFFLLTISLFCVVIFLVFFTTAVQADDNFIYGQNFRFTLHQEKSDLGFQIYDNSGNLYFSNKLLTIPNGYSLLNEDKENQKITQTYYHSGQQHYLKLELEIVNGNRTITIISVYSDNPAGFFIEGDYFSFASIGDNFPFRFKINHCGNNYLGSTIGADGQSELGDWQKQGYWPRNLEAPSVGIYNKDVGQVVTVIGQDILSGNRIYEFFLKADDNSDDLLGITPQFYDLATDKYLKTKLIKPDEIFSISYIIEPFFINVAENLNSRTIDNQTRKVMDVSAAHIRDYLLEDSNVASEAPLNLNQVLKIKGLIDSITLEQLMSEYRAVAGEAGFGAKDDYKCGHLRGIDCQYLLGEEGEPKDINLDNLNVLDKNNFLLLHYNNISTLGLDSAEYEFYPQCAVKDNDGNFIYKKDSEGEDNNNVYFNYRNSDCREYVVDKFIYDFNNYFGLVDGIRFDEPLAGVVIEKQTNIEEGFSNAYQGLISFYYDQLVPALRQNFPDIVLAVNGPIFIKSQNALDYYSVGDCMYPDAGKHPEWGKFQFDTRLLKYFYSQLSNKSIGFGMGSCNTAVHAIQYGLLQQGPGISYPEDDSDNCAYPKKHEYLFAKKHIELMDKGGFEVLDEKIYWPTGSEIIPREVDSMVMLSKLRTKNDSKDYLIAGAYNKSFKIVYNNLTNFYPHELYYMEDSPVLNIVSMDQIESIENNIAEDDIMIASTVPVEIIPATGTIEATIDDLNNQYFKISIKGNSAVTLNIKNLPSDEDYIMKLNDNELKFNSGDQGQYTHHFNLANNAVIEVSGNLNFTEYQNSPDLNQDGNNQSQQDNQQTAPANTNIFAKIFNWLIGFWQVIKGLLVKIF